MLKLYKFKEFLSEKYFKTDVGSRFDNPYEFSEPYHLVAASKTRQKAVMLHQKKIDDLHLRLLDHYGNAKDAKSRYAVKNYTEGSKKINGYLHEKHKNPELNYGLEQEEISKVLSNHLTQIKAPETFHVYAGLYGDPSRSKKVGVTDVENTKDHYKAHLPAFTSTTLNPAITQRFVKRNKTNHEHILKIEIPKGSKYGRYIDGDSFHLGEKEFLLDKGKNIHISKKPQIINRKDNTITHIWHAKIV